MVILFILLLVSDAYHFLVVISDMGWSADDCLPSTNVASGKPSSSSSVNEGSTASNAFDGNMSSRWESAHGIDTVYLQVDLEQVYNIEKVSVAWEFACAKIYDIQVSNDGLSFNTVWSKTNGFGGMGTIESVLSGASGRFVRMQAHERATAWGYSVFEMEVYGSSSDIEIEGQPI